MWSAYGAKFFGQVISFRIDELEGSADGLSSGYRSTTDNESDGLVDLGAQEAIWTRARHVFA
jgi:hypothetical protein